MVSVLLSGLWKEDGWGRWEGVEATGDRVRGESSSSKPNRRGSAPPPAGVEWPWRGLGTLNTGLFPLRARFLTAGLWGPSLGLLDDRGESCSTLFSFSSMALSSLVPSLKPEETSSLSSTLIISSVLVLSRSSLFT